MAPALRGARFNLAESLHGGDGASAGGFRGLRARRLREGLLVAEAAFAVLLLVAAMMLARSFIKLTQVDAGYTSMACSPPKSTCPAVTRTTCSFHKVPGGRS